MRHSPFRRAVLPFLTASGFGVGVLLGVAWGLLWPRDRVTGAPPARRARPQQPTSAPRSAA